MSPLVSSRFPVRSLALCCLAVVTVTIAVGGLAGTAAAIEEPADGQFVVELDADGDADVVFTSEFDLTDPEQQAAFEEVHEDDARKESAGAQFRENMRFVSAVANEEVDRELRIDEVTVGTTVDGDRGVLVYQFRWENLAAVDGDRIVLSEPFSIYDELDRELVVFAPEGGELENVSPEPAERGEDVARWPGLTAFGEEFEVVATAPSDAPPQFSDGSDTYGAGPTAIGVSVLLFVTLFIGRQR